MVLSSINRLRADLDELRATTTASSRQGSQALDAAPGTVGRSLEKELLRQLQSSATQKDHGPESEEDEGAESEEDRSYVETVITTSRRRVSSSLVIFVLLPTIILLQMHGLRKSAPVIEIRDQSTILDFEDVAVRSKSYVFAQQMFTFHVG